MSDTNNDLKHQHNKKTSSSSEGEETMSNLSDETAGGTTQSQDTPEDNYSMQQELYRAREEARENYERLQKATAIIDQLKAKIAKLEARFPNYQKQVELASFQKLESLLPTIDDFKRASQLVPEDFRQHQWLEGIFMIQDNFNKNLLAKIQQDNKILLDKTLLDNKILLDKTLLSETPLSQKLQDDIQQNQKAIQDIIQSNIEETLLGKFPIEEINPASGEQFDPNLHQAIGIDDSDEVESGHITVTLRIGYCIGELVLFPALVRVAS